MERLAAAALGCLIALSVCTSSRGASGISAGQALAPSATSVTRDERPHCGVISLTSRRYGSHLEMTSGRSGDSVGVLGTMLRGEN